MKDPRDAQLEQEIEEEMAKARVNLEAARVHLSKLEQMAGSTTVSYVAGQMRYRSDPAHLDKAMTWFREELRGMREWERGRGRNLRLVAATEADPEGAA